MVLGLVEAEEVEEERLPGTVAVVCMRVDREVTDDPLRRGCLRADLNARRVARRI